MYKQMFKALMVLPALFWATPRAWAANPYNPEPESTGSALYFDNDLLAPHSHDRDYTGGLSLTLSGHSVTEDLISVEGARSWLDEHSGFAGRFRDAAITRHSQEFGLTVFTPQQLSDETAQRGDRPYASLLYVSNTAVNVVPDREVAYLSTFTLGLLAAPGVADIQQGIHRASGSEQPKGWDKQISDGGELTARYSAARASRVWNGQLANSRAEVTSTVRASVGYLTEASIGFAARVGDSYTPWWSYNPQLTDYAEKSVPITAAEGNHAEHYFWAGINFRARFYNAFLQGQFRDSEVNFSHDELRPLVVEAWAGYTWAFANGWRYSYQLRSLSSEIKHGPGDRNLIWGGMVVSQSY